MGLRKYKRQIARGFMTDAGIGNVNRKMGALVDGGLADGVKLWRRALGEHAKWCRTRKTLSDKRDTSRNIKQIGKAAKA